MAILYVFLLLPSHLWQIATFLLFCGIVILIWLRDLPEWHGLAYPDNIEAHVVNELQRIESDLIHIRRQEQLMEWKRFNGIPLSWQVKSIALKELAFELFLINEVWATKGKEYAKYRFNESPHKAELKPRHILFNYLKEETA